MNILPEEDQSTKPYDGSLIKNGKYYARVLKGGGSLKNLEYTQEEISSGLLWNNKLVYRIKGTYPENIDELITSNLHINGIESIIPIIQSDITEYGEASASSSYSSSRSPFRVFNKKKI